MPRKRQIDPDYFDDELMVSLPIEACHLYQGLWTRADDAWNVEDSVRQWFVWFFRGRYRDMSGDPYTVDDVARWRELLVNSNRLLLYAVDGKYYCHLPHMAKHQSVQHPSKPRCPSPPDTILSENLLRTHGALIEDSLTTQCALNQNRVELRGEEKRGGVGGGTPTPFSLEDPETIQAILSHHKLHNDEQREALAEILSYPAPWGNSVDDVVSHYMRFLADYGEMIDSAAAFKREFAAFRDYHDSPGKRIKARPWTALGLNWFGRKR